MGHGVTESQRRNLSVVSATLWQTSSVSRWLRVESTRAGGGSVRHVRPQLAFVLGALAYVFAPGHSGVPDHGAPIGPFAAAALALVLFAVAFWWRADVSRTKLTRIAMAMWACALLKVAIGIAAPTEGWLASQYANDTLRPPIRRSTEFHLPDATRIDRSIQFREDRFPVYFLNEADFNRGLRREVDEPFSIRWIGHIDRPGAGVVRLSLAARGALEAKIDGASTATLDAVPPVVGRADATVPLAPGPHVVEITYRKAAVVHALVEVSARDASGPIVPVTPHPVSAARRLAGRLLTYPAWALHVAVAGLTIAALIILYRASPLVWTWTGDGGARTAAFVMFAIFFVQGLIRSAPFIGRTWRLSGGDDWLAYEASAREIATGGILMTYGERLGHGFAYFYYPLYSYFIALVHILVGEDLFGVIFVQFLILAITGIVVHRTAKMLFGPTVALWALVALLVEQQLDFVRYYTVTLLSENLYFLPVALTVYFLVSFAQSRSRAAVVLAGLSGGVAALTRPSMMMFLPLSMVLVAVIEQRGGERFTKAVRSTLVYGAVFIGIVLLATIRNYVVSGHAVLITAGQGGTFIDYNAPTASDAVAYKSAWTGTMASAAWILLRMSVEHPIVYLTGVFTKVMFSLGMTQWMGQRIHPELVLPSAGYFLAFVFCPHARRLAAWPAHLFVITHLASLTLTMPGRYGYRLILPNYLFFAIFTAAFIVRIVELGRRRLPPARVG